MAHSEDTRGIRVQEAQRSKVKKETERLKQSTLAESDGPGLFVLSQSE